MTRTTGCHRHYQMNNLRYVMTPASAAPHRCMVCMRLILLAAITILAAFSWLMIDSTTAQAQRGVANPEEAMDIQDDIAGRSSDDNSGNEEDSNNDKAGSEEFNGPGTRDDPPEGQEPQDRQDTIDDIANRPENPDSYPDEGDEFNGPGAQDEPPDQGEGSNNASEEDSGNPLINWVKDAVFATVGDMFNNAVNTIGGYIEMFGELMADWAFSLPEPHQKTMDIYRSYVDVMKPVAAAALVLCGLLKIVADSNNAIRYHTVAVFKRVAFFLVAVAFFPTFVSLLQGLTQDLSNVFIADQKIGEAFRAWASRDVLFGVFPATEASGKTVRVMDYLTAPTKITKAVAIGRLTGVLIIILLIPILVMLLFLLMATIIKNMVFYMLVMAGPLALACYVIPGLSNVTAAWFRGVLACAAISMLLAIELALGSLIIETPQILVQGGAFANNMPFVRTLIFVVLLYLMIKTVTAVFKWAFFSYGGNGVRTAEGMATRAGLSGIASRIFRK